RSKAEAKDNEGSAIEACSDRAGIDAQKTPRAYKGRREAAHCRSLISHSRSAVSVSCASGLGGLCSWSKKYTPLTFATSGEVASHTRVSAPFSRLRATGLRIVIPKFISRPLLRLNPVATSPGWKQFAVTPVPSRRRASSVFHQTHIAWIMDFVAKHRLPAAYQLSENLRAGGLMSYGASQPDLFRRAAGYVHRILQGTKP